MFLRGCPLKTVSPSGTICHAPGVLGAGDRYFLQGAAPFHFLRAPSRNLLPPFIYISPSSRKKEARVSPGPLFKNVSGLEHLARWVTWADRENTGFCSPWMLMLMISQNRMLVFGRALSQFTCCSFSGSGPNFSKGIFPYLWWWFRLG